MSYPLLQKAIRYAAKLHEGQDRDGENALPYITHPIEVLGFLRKIGGVTDEEMLCAAVLHDVIEECGEKPKKLEEKFGKRVRDLVVELSRQEPSPEQIKDLDEAQIWQLRAEMLLEEIGKMGPEAQTIKLADRLSNVLDALRTKEGEKLERYLWQSRRILEIVPREVNPGLWESVKASLPPAKKGKTR